MKTIIAKTKNFIEVITSCIGNPESHRLLLKITKTLAALIIAFSFYGNCKNTVDPDMGWHIKIGYQILESGSVPRSDNLTFTMSGHEWVDHEWLPDSLFALADKSGNWRLVVIIFTLISFIPFAYWTIRIRKFAEFIPLIAAAILYGSFVSVRPQVITMAFFFAVFQMTRSAYVKNVSLSERKNKYLLPIIFLAWSNLHAGFFSGLILIAFYIFTRYALSAAKLDKKYSEMKNDILSLVVLALVSLINPYGISLYKEILVASTSPIALKYVKEWHPIFSSEFVAKRIYYIAIFIVSTLLFMKRKRIFDLSISIIFLAMAIRSLRMVPLFILSSLPLVMAYMRDYAASVQKTKSFLQPKQVLIRTLLFIAIVSYLSAVLIGSSGHKISGAIYPNESTAKFLQEYAGRHQDLRIFNNYAWGGFLSYHVPEIKLFIDGRMPHWKKDGHSAMEDYVQAVYGNDWEDIFEKWDINLVLINKEINTSKPSIIKRIHLLIYKSEPVNKNTLLPELLKNGWVVIHEDPYAAVLAKQQLKNGY